MKLVPAAGIVAEPAAELSARRRLLQPSVDSGVRFAQAARPKAIHQDAGAVLGRRRQIGALQTNIHARRLLRHSLLPIRPHRAAIVSYWADCHSFSAVDLRHLLLAGFPAHSHRSPGTIGSQRPRNGGSGATSLQTPP